MSTNQIVPQQLPKLTAFNSINVVRFEYEITFDRLELRKIDTLNTRTSVTNSSVFSPPEIIDPLFFVSLEYEHNSKFSLKLNLKHTVQSQLAIDYKCSVLNQQGVKLNTRESTIQFHGEITKAKIFNYHSDDSAYHYANHPVPLEIVFKNNIVTFLCEFTLYLVTEKTEKLSSSVLNRLGEMRIHGNVADNSAEIGGQFSLIADIEALWYNRKNSDFAFKFPNGKELKVHKLILCTRSAVFSAMFEHSTTRELQESCVEIVDSSLEAFDAFLHFLYTGKCAGLDQFDTELLVLADKYQVDSLKTICETHLCTTISATNMFNLLLLADTHGAVKLKANVVNYISKNSSVQDAVKAAFSLNNPELLVQQIRALTLQTK